MQLLAIETSGERGSVALQAGSAVRQREVPRAREQTALILPLIDELLVAAGLDLRDLDGIAFGRGPGSFTGLRVAAAIAQGLGLATGLPLVAVSSMGGLARQASELSGLPTVVVCLDARMDEIYTGTYTLAGGRTETIRAEAIGRPEDVIRPAGDFAAAGTAFGRYPEQLAGIAAGAGWLAPELEPRAADLFAAAQAQLAAGQIVTPAAAVPVYLRDSTAWEPYRGPDLTHL
jgi:tRNA threonylcarbamoyladenosine biosynthesis protein TsaB